MNLKDENHCDISLTELPLFPSISFNNGAIPFNPIASKGDNSVKNREIA